MNAWSVPECALLISGWGNTRIAEVDEFPQVLQSVQSSREAMDYLLRFLMSLLFWGAAVWALKTGEVFAKGSVIKRADYPLAFHLLVGLYIIFGSVVWLI